MKVNPKQNMTLSRAISMKLFPTPQIATPSLCLQRVRYTQYSSSWCAGLPLVHDVILDLARVCCVITAGPHSCAYTYKGVADDLAGRYLNLYLLQSLNQPSGLQYCRHELPGKSRLAHAITGSNRIHQRRLC